MATFAERLQWPATDSETGHGRYAWQYCALARDGDQSERSGSGTFGDRQNEYSADAQNLWRSRPELQLQRHSSRRLPRADEYRQQAARSTAHTVAAAGTRCRRLLGTALVVFTGLQSPTIDAATRWRNGSHRKSL